MDDVNAARALLERPKVERLREVAGALPGYGRYVLYHLLAWPYLALKGLERAKTQGYQGLIWRRLWGGSKPPRRDRWTILTSTDLGETRTALLAAGEISGDDRSVAILVARKAAYDMAVRKQPPGSKGAFVGVAPFNNPFSVLLGLWRWRPRCVFFVDHNYNHHLTFWAKLLGVKTVMFNVFLTESEAGWKRLQAERRAFIAWRRREIGAYGVHSEVHRERLLSLGVDPDRIVVTGPLLGVPQQSPAARQDALSRWKAFVNPADPSVPVVVAGSTHTAEERLLLEAFARFRARHPQAVLVLAPRNLTRDEGIDAAAEPSGLPFVRWSQTKRRDPAIPVVLLDAMGELANAYAVATVAHVGGGFDARLGGHTPVEALAWGVPMTIGPDFEQQRALVEILEEAGALAVCSSPTDLERAWQGWACDNARRAAVCETLRRLVERHRDVFRKLYDGLIC